MADLKHGYIFTTEPIAMRAFAAELRHDLAATGRLIADVLKEDLGTPEYIQCEAREGIDVLVGFPGHVEVGIEGKIDHSVTAIQIARERAAVSGRLILLVKERQDVIEAQSTLGTTLFVVTWEEALSYFRDSRISLEDVEAVNDEKRIARRALGAVDTSQVPDEWDLVRKDGEGGWPSITAKGPYLPGGRRLILQIEMVRPKNEEKEPGKEKSAKRRQYAGTIGITVLQDEFDPFDVNTAGPDRPEWIVYLDRLGGFLKKRLATTDAVFSTAAGRAGKSELGASKVAQAIHFGLPLSYAKGYVGDYLGVRTQSVAADGLGPLAVSVLNSAVELDAFLRYSPQAEVN